MRTVGKFGSFPSRGQGVYKDKQLLSVKVRIGSLVTQKEGEGKGEEEGGKGYGRRLSAAFVFVSFSPPSPIHSLEEF